MSLLSVKDFAAICRMPEKNIHTAKSRNKIVFTPDPANAKKNLIDNENPINKAFVADREAYLVRTAKIEMPDIGLDNFSLEDKPSHLPEKDKEGKKGKKNILQLLEEEKELRIAVLKREVVKRDIDIDKKNALLIPTELVKAFFKTDHFIIGNHIKTTIERQIDLITLKYHIPANEVAEIRKKIFSDINTGFENAEKEMISNINIIQNEYAETRERGERK